MKKNIWLTCCVVFLSLTAWSVLLAQNKKAVKQPTVKEVRKQKVNADKEIKETQTQLGINEKKVTESMAALRQIEDNIATSQRDIETIQRQLVNLRDTITGLETSIEEHESDLALLRNEYLKSVKKMRVARKRNSGLVFLFAAKNLGDARRRMRYMREFSAWKTRRTDEISNRVELLSNEKHQLVQAREDVSTALQREEEAQKNLASQRNQQQTVIKELQANSEALRNKLARRQAEARELGNQISQLIAEQKAKEAEEAARKKAAEEERRLAQQKAAAEKKAAEEKRLAQQKAEAEKKAAAERQLAAAEAQKKQKSQSKQKETTTPKPAASPDKGEYASARRRKSRNNAADQPAAQPAGNQNVSSGKEMTVVNPDTPTPTGFESMKGKLPKPVGGSFKIVSAFGVHPVSPDLPDILDENLGIDAHVANGSGACAVYEGDVIKIYDRTTTTGFRNIVVVKHGDFITVYANLETLAVKAGQHVTQGQCLGTVGADFDNPSKGMIHFELWKNQTRLDPAKWIKI